VYLYSFLRITYAAGTVLSEELTEAPAGNSRRRVKWTPQISEVQVRTTGKRHGCIYVPEQTGRKTSQLRARVGFERRRLWPACFATNGAPQRRRVRDQSRRRKAARLDARSYVIIFRSFVYGRHAAYVPEVALCKAS